MLETTLERLHQMRLPIMAEKLLELKNTPSQQGMSWADAISMLVDGEYLDRGNKRIVALLKHARLKYPSASVEDVQYSSARGLSKDQIRPLLDLSFIRQMQNVSISGATGTGKSYLACVLANLACRNGIPTQYARIGLFLDYMVAEKALGNYAKAMDKLKKIKLLILDDMGADTLERNQRKILLDVVDDFYLERSLVITSQVPPDQWDAVIGDPSTAEAICDRLFHNCHKISLKGESLRQKKLPQKGGN